MITMAVGLFCTNAKIVCGFQFLVWRFLFRHVTEDHHTAARLPSLFDQGGADLHVEQTFVFRQPPRFCRRHFAMANHLLDQSFVSALFSSGIKLSRLPLISDNDQPNVCENAGLTSTTLPPGRRSQSGRVKIRSANGGALHSRVMPPRPVFVR